jgi:hypothetical protein
MVWKMLITPSYCHLLIRTFELVDLPPDMQTQFKHLQSLPLGKDWTDILEQYAHTEIEGKSRKQV